MEELIVLKIIPRETAEHICAEIRAEAQREWYSAAARWCWKCQQAASHDPEKRGFLNKPGNRGCHLVNTRFAQLSGYAQLHSGMDAS